MSRRPYRKDEHPPISRVLSPVHRQIPFEPTQVAAHCAFVCWFWSRINIFERASHAPQASNRA